MGTLKVDNVVSNTSNTMNLGVTGDTVTVPSGATLSIPSGATLNVAGTASGTIAPTADSTASVKGKVIVAGTSPVSVSYSSGTATVALASSVVQKTVQNTFTKAQLPSTYTAALSATSGVLDFDTYQNFIITLAAGSNTLAAPTTEASQIGQTGVMIFINPSSGNAATISLHADYETAEAAGLTISSANNDYDVVPYIVKADNSVLLGAPQLNFG